jgi:hypothetical protein
MEAIMRFTILLSLFGLLFFSACSDNGSTGANDDQIPPQTLDQLEGAGSSGGDATMLVDQTEEDLAIVDEMDFVDFGTGDPENLAMFADRIEDRSTFHQEMIPTISFCKANGDSVIYDTTFTDRHGNEVHQWLTYNAETDSGSLYAVTMHSGNFFRALDYDSAAMDLDMGPDPWDFRDDIIHRVYEYRRYDESFMLAEQSSEYTIHAYLDSRPSDYDAVIVKNFRSDSRLKSMRHEIERNADKSGRLYQGVVDSDDNSREIEYVYNGDGTGTYMRNISGVLGSSGTFNVLRDDNVGAYTRNVTFLDDRNLSNLKVSGALTYSQAEGLLIADITKIYIFNGGEIDTYYVHVERRFDPDARIRQPLATDIELDGTNGVASQLQIDHVGRMADLSGWWVSEEGYYSTLDGQHYFLEMNTLRIDMYASKDGYDNGEEQIAWATFETQADGSGNAVIYIDGVAYTFDFDASGRGVLRKLNRAIKSIIIRF